MTEKNRVIAMGLVLLAIQALVGWSVFLSIAWMKENWSSLTGDNVPDWTHWALAYGLAIPLLAVAATVVVLAVLLWRDCRVGNWLLSIAIVEIVALSLFAASITCPAATIMYRVSGGAKPFGIYLTQYDSFKIVP